MGGGIPVWIDTRPAIAHNKILIIDGTEVITGSFNFTDSAQNRNAENLVFISDDKVAQEYRNTGRKGKVHQYHMRR